MKLWSNRGSVNNNEVRWCSWYTKANLQSLKPNLARRPAGRETELIFLGVGIGIWRLGFLGAFKELVRTGSSRELVLTGGIGGLLGKESLSSSDSVEESSLASVVSFPERSRKEVDFRRREKEENLSPTARLMTERLFFLFPASERLLDSSKWNLKNDKMSPHTCPAGPCDYCWWNWLLF